MGPKRKYSSLLTYLTLNPLTVDATVDDGWGENLPVKGREIEAVILFADIAAFSRRTAEMNPTETLIFVNTFIAWITAESLRHHGGIVDKYIGDEVMIVFAREFGSEDPIADALACAVDICQLDPHSFCPHVGLAAGRVIAGITGTNLSHGASVFGAPVTLAARCVGCDLRETGASYTVTMPADLWGDRELKALLTQTKAVTAYPGHTETDWRIGEPKDFAPKNLDSIKIRQLYRTGIWLPPPGASAEDRARRTYASLVDSGWVRKFVPRGQPKK